jgi:hypothetical protein
MYTYRIFEGNQKEGDLDVGVRVIIKMDLGKIGRRVRSGLIWFGTETSDRLFGFHKVLGNWVSSN